MKLDKLNDPLVELKEHIDFEVFREAIKKVFEEPRRSNARRKQLNIVFTLKILLLQRVYNLSEKQVEFPLNDRLSFCRFLGLPLRGTTLDYTTVWEIREALTQAGAVKALFDLFAGLLEDKRLVKRERTLVDARSVEFPRQRNTKEENDLVKNGETPEQWKAHTAKLR